MNRPAETAVSKGWMAFETAGAAIGLLDSKGTVVGWSQAARRLVGYWAAEGVGQCGGVLLVAADDEAKASQAAVQSALWGRWSDHAQVRHRDGHSIDVRLCESALSGQDARARWSGPPTRLHSPAAPEGTGVESLPGKLPLPSRLPIGIVIRDTQLRCIWVNDIRASKGGIPHPQWLGHRLTEAVSGAEAETWADQRLYDYL